MEIFITVVILAIVALAIKYYLDHHKSKGVLVSEASVEEAPYKVEPPVGVATAVDVSPELVAKAAQAVPAAPELKVVSGAKKAQPKRSAAPKAKPAAKAKAAPAAKPRAPKKPAK